jgi:hypothetical protein
MKEPSSSVENDAVKRRPHLLPARRSGWIVLVLLAGLSAAQDNRSQRRSNDPAKPQSGFIVGPCVLYEVAITGTVLDKRNQPVTGFVPSDFTVYEDGRRQKVNHFQLIGTQYRFTYKPTNPLRNGGVRAIKIKIHKHGLRVQAAPNTYVAHVKNEIPSSR